MTPVEKPKTYTEEQLAIEKLKWEQVEKDKRFETALAQLSGQFTAIPAQMELIATRAARSVVQEVLDSQEKQRNSHADRRWTRADQFAALINVAQGGLLIFLTYRLVH